MKLGTENRKTVIVAAVLGVVAILTVVYEFMPSSSTIASTGTSTGVTAGSSSMLPRPAARHGTGTGAGKKERAPQSLDPTLQLQQLAATEQIKYEGSGRNIFVAQADVEIPKPLTQGATDVKNAPTYTPPPVPQQAPIPLKFFGFASQPGEPKRVFLIKGEDTFIAGEGEIIDRRYKVVRISPTSVDIQDVVGSGPPQSIPLTQG
ncbi:MAG: hypothetical protein WCC99_03275 [Candidatus Sulfotelmatobacter sp.]